MGSPSAWENMLLHGVCPLCAVQKTWFFPSFFPTFPLRKKSKNSGPPKLKNRTSVIYNIDFITKNTNFFVAEYHFTGCRSWNEFSNRPNLVFSNSICLCVFTFFNGHLDNPQNLNWQVRAVESKWEHSCESSLLNFI